MQAEDSLLQTLAPLLTSYTKSIAPFLQTITVTPSPSLLPEANSFLQSTNYEVNALYKHLTEKYSVRLPEMASLNMTPFEYAKTVRAIGDAWDLTKIDLKNVIAPATALVVTLSASTTLGRRLVTEELQYVERLTDLLLLAEQTNKEILDFLEQQMPRVAPNLTALIGTRIAGQVVGAAGSILALSRIPANNLQVLGRVTKDTVGYSKSTQHVGYLWDCDLVRNTEKEYQAKALRLVAAKVALASRIDSQGANQDGDMGRVLRNDIITKLEKAAEPVTLTEIKALAPPDAKPRRKRGGKRQRRLKELTAMTDARKAANRIAFGEAEAEIIVGEDVKGLGMLKTGASLRPIKMDTKLRERLIKKVAMSGKK